MATTILVIEDEAHIRQGLEMNLQFEGYQVVTCADGREGIDQALRLSPDLILLDVMLPSMNGYDVCRMLRKSQIGCPIIMLTAKTAEDDKILGFSEGADDYITKPFSVREVIARVNAQLRRSERDAPTARAYRFGDFVLDLRGQTLTQGKKPLAMTATELKLLKYLIENEGRVLARDEILRRVWGHDYYGTARTVDNFITKLRQKVEKNPDAPTLIVTARGMGYKFVGQAEAFEPSDDRAAAPRKKP